MDRIEGHGGTHVVSVLQQYGVNEIFTLSGAHVFAIYDACVQRGVKIVDVRHEQTAGFAAEGMSKLGRRPGVAVLTAGPGVTNSVSAVASAQANGSPVLIIGGRAPAKRWGLGSLQEFEQVPVFSTITKQADTALRVEDISPMVSDALETSLRPHRGPVFLDIPADVLNASATTDAPVVRETPTATPDTDSIARAVDLLSAASRPVMVAGTDVWWAGAWDELRKCAETLQIPTFTNGMGRGCLPVESEMYFSRSRSKLKAADVVVVVGTPLDFRLSYGVFGEAKVIHVVDSPEQRRTRDAPALTLVGDIKDSLSALNASVKVRPQQHSTWIEELRDCEIERRQGDDSELGSTNAPIHPSRIYGELRDRLEKNAVVIGDGGDFVSYAGRFIEPHYPGLWLDTGPFGCLGSGLGHSIAARLTYPDRQVVLLAGDGALGFAGMDIDTLVRLRLPVTIIVGNNGTFGLEKHPMLARYGYYVAADLQSGCRYDLMAKALGANGELVTDPDDIGGALDRAFASGETYLVNVLTDPSIAYPRTSF
jgi:acetolactate synthase I/II/III large subunit